MGNRLSCSTQALGPTMLGTNPRLLLCRHGALSRPVTFPGDLPHLMRKVSSTSPSYTTWEHSAVT